MFRRHIAKRQAKLDLLAMLEGSSFSIEDEAAAISATADAKVTINSPVSSSMLNIQFSSCYETLSYHHTKKIIT